MNWLKETPFLGKLSMIPRGEKRKQFPHLGQHVYIWKSTQNWVHTQQNSYSSRHYTALWLPLWQYSHCSLTRYNWLHQHWCCQMSWTSDIVSNLLWLTSHWTQESIHPKCQQAVSCYLMTLFLSTKNFDQSWLEVPSKFYLEKLPLNITMLWFY